MDRYNTAPRTSLGSHFPEGRSDSGSSCQGFGATLTFLGELDHGFNNVQYMLYSLKRHFGRIPGTPFSLKSGEVVLVCPESLIPAWNSRSTCTLTYAAQNLSHENAATSKLATKHQLHPKVLMQPTIPSSRASFLKVTMWFQSTPYDAI